MIKRTEKDAESIRDLSLLKNLKSIISPKVANPEGIPLGVAKRDKKSLAAFPKGMSRPVGTPSEDTQRLTK